MKSRSYSTRIGIAGRSSRVMHLLHDGEAYSSFQTSDLFKPRSRNKPVTSPCSSVAVRLPHRSRIRLRTSASDSFIRDGSAYFGGRQASTMIRSPGLFVTAAATTSL